MTGSALRSWVAAMSLIMLGCLWPVAASAQDSVGTYRIAASGSGQSRTCSVTLEPNAAFGGADAPRLTISSPTRYRPGQARFGVADSRNYREVKFVTRNQRRAMPVYADTSTTSIKNNDLFRALMTRTAVSVTARLKNGDYVSSRFDNFDMPAILSAMSRDCPFSTEDLSDSVSSAAAQAERRLSISSSDLMRIRWVLARRSGQLAIPTDTGPITPRERELLMGYGIDHGLPISRYVNEQSLRALRSEVLSPLRPNNSWMNNVRVHDQWRSYTYMNGSTKVCGIASEGNTSDSEAFWEYPMMRYEADQGDSGNSMNLYMVAPNPFDESRNVYAVVDGATFPLQIRYGTVRPAQDGEYLDSSVIQAIRRGTYTVIHGTSAVTGQAISVSFSADGFTASFNDMVRNCGRPRLRDWIN